MQMSYPLEAYRLCVQRAFCEMLIQERYASELPNIGRFTKFLTRVKEQDPALDLPELCRTGLPPNWVYIQYNRGPLEIVDEDEFRKSKIKVISEDKTCFDETRWGFGRVELNYWLVANNGSAIDIAEALYYMRLYKVRSIDYTYQWINWRSRVIHSALQSFDELGMDEIGTGFTVTWNAEFFVPVLRQEVEGFTIQETLTNVFDRSSIRLQPAPSAPLRDPVLCDDDTLVSFPGDDPESAKCPVMPTPTDTDFGSDPPENAFLEQIASDGDGSHTINDPPVVEEEP